jgi:transcriptional regulator with XRE-family HTH domain
VRDEEDQPARYPVLSDRHAALGAAIRQRRLTQHLSVRELAENAGCSQSLLARAEFGRANLTLEKLHGIAQALNTPTTDLVAAYTD